MSDKNAIEYSAIVSTDEAASYLESLAHSLRSGAALLESGDNSLTLEVGPTVQLELEASSNSEKGKSSIELSLTWRVAEQVKPAPSLVIVAGTPAAATADAE